MVYSVPADPGWDLQALLDKVPELAKKAIAGGLFLRITIRYDLHYRKIAPAEAVGIFSNLLRASSRDLAAAQQPWTRGIRARKSF